MSPKKDTRTSAKSTTVIKRKLEGFTAEERVARAAAASVSSPREESATHPPFARSTRAPSTRVRGSSSGHQLPRPRPERR